MAAFSALLELYLLQATCKLSEVVEKGYRSLKPKQRTSIMNDYHRYTIFNLPHLKTQFVHNHKILTNA